MEPDKHQRIVEAAAGCFVRLGFKATSIDEIAKTANVAKGTVYLACKSKADLFYQAVHADLQAWAAQISRYVDPRRPAGEILTQMAMAGIKYLAKHPLVRDLFAGVHAGALPEWADRFDELRIMGRAIVAQVLSLGVRQGEFHADLDIPLTAAVLQDIQHAGYIIHGQRWTRDPTDATARMEAQVDLVLNGLRTRPQK
ncbi:MAG: TetR/AcrR family transcriptional regulator [Nannocystaceae bacterium]|nr:TetR/AcrR family transcriptional regulator [Nannocystaceae bacterium]